MKTLTLISTLTILVLTSCNQADEYVCYCTNPTGAVSKVTLKPDDPNFQDRKASCKANPDCEWLEVND